MIVGGKIEKRDGCQKFMGVEPWESGKNRFGSLPSRRVAATHKWLVPRPTECSFIPVIYVLPPFHSAFSGDLKTLVEIDKVCTIFQIINT